MRTILALTMMTLLVLTTARASDQLDSSKGEALLKAMSQRLAAARTFTFSTAEFHDRIDRAGRKVQLNLIRDVLVQRPNGFWTKYKGDRDWEFWYDGKVLTGISNDKKIYIQHEMPPTLDETMDMLSERLNIDLPVSDVLYSSPYEAFIDSQTHGGYSSKELIDGSSCNHLSYSDAAVDWQLWIDEKTSLPCKLEMTYKKDAGHSFYRITFSKWNLSAESNKQAFTAKIPDGYVRIPILERVLLQTQTQKGQQ
ncbi:MAG: hypothetical protein C5B54_10545 [Acidobacteria bacterium]|nr:MAG: hypothetical protein C5B54_10545 [Acidobacteriota bacterium]